MIWRRCARAGWSGRSSGRKQRRQRHLVARGCSASSSARGTANGGCGLTYETNSTHGRSPCAARRSRASRSRSRCDLAVEAPGRVLVATPASARGRGSHWPAVHRLLVEPAEQHAGRRPCRPGCASAASSSLKPLSSSVERKWSLPTETTRWPCVAQGGASSSATRRRRRSRCPSSRSGAGSARSRAPRAPGSRAGSPSRRWRSARPRAAIRSRFGVRACGWP